MTRKWTRQFYCRDSPNHGTIFMSRIRKGKTLFSLQFGPRVAFTDSRGLKEVFFRSMSDNCRYPPPFSIGAPLIFVAARIISHSFSSPRSTSATESRCFCGAVARCMVWMPCRLRCHSIMINMETCLYGLATPLGERHLIPHAGGTH